MYLLLAFLQIKLYAEAGGRPQTYRQQGYAWAGMDDYYSGTYGPKWTINYWVFYKVAISSYILLSCSLMLLIPRLLASYYTKVVANSSVYWGSALVCVSLATLLSLYKLTLGSMIANLEIILPLQLGYVIPVSIIGAIIVSRNITIPIPSFKFTAHVIFCCWPCFCCSRNCKSRGIHVLITWSTIMVIYHSIVEIIALISLMFVNITLTISYTVLFISCMFFLTMLASQIFHLLSDETSRSSKQSMRCFLAITEMCSITCSFGVVICIVLIYIIIATSNIQFQGFKGLLFSLIPSAVLSAAGWFIKYTMFKKRRPDTQPPQPPSGYGAINEQEV